MAADDAVQDALVIVLQRAYRTFRPSERITDEAIDRLAEEWGRLFGGKIPAEQIEPSYDAWQLDERPRFFPKPADLLDAFDRLTAGKRQPASAPTPKLVDGQVTYACRHCSDLGYQSVWIWHRGLGYRSAARGCECNTAPSGQRSMMALTEPQFLYCNGTWARRSDLREYGAPSHHWALIVQQVKEQPAPRQQTQRHFSAEPERMPF
jgi:hypothetical protein